MRTKRLIYGIDRFNTHYYRKLEIESSIAMSVVVTVTVTVMMVMMKITMMRVMVSKPSTAKKSLQHLYFYLRSKMVRARLNSWL